MTLAPRTRVGPFEIVGILGAGGMGEVYRARDTNLGRDVALKVLPADWAADPDRIARFRREAHVLASLNHPNIAAIYGFEQVASTGAGQVVHALALELVEGEDLATRLGRGPVPADDAVSIARQIADALEAAHESGIVHRDLKPANVKLRPDGTVKVLDFGLAKAVQASAGADGTTMTSPAVTGLGIILGTAAYMAPEQAKGRQVDRRADIWAFGVVCWEMLTGRRLFGGESVTEVVAAVLRQDIDLAALPPETPLRVRWLIGRCLDRDPRTRLRDIGEARIALAPDEASATVTPPAASKPFPWLAAAGVGLAAVIAAFAAGRWLGSERTTTAGTRAAPVVSDIVAPAGGTWSLDGAAPGTVVVSPDGRRLAFVVVEGSARRLWVRELDSAEARVIPQSEDAQYPFWSPDGNQIAFFARGQLWTSGLTDSRPVPIAPANDGKGGAWSSAGVIVFTPESTQPLFRVPATGGTPVALTSLAGAGDRSHRHPRFLPDGRRFLFLSRGATDAQNRVMAGTIDGGEPRELLRHSSHAEIAAGRLLWVDSGVLYAQAIDPDRLELRGDRVVLARDVVDIFGAALSAFSAVPGTLAYHRGLPSPETQLVWVDRKGQTSPAFEPFDGLQSVRLSPDGRQAAVTIVDPTTQATDVWVLDLERGVRILVSATERPEYEAIWAADGRSLIFATDEGTGHMRLRSMAVQGGAASERLVHESDADLLPQAVSPDGRWLLYQATHGPASASLHVLALDGSGESRVVASSGFRHVHGRFSPDGRWLSFASNETGQWEVYVAPFPALDRKWQVSRGGGFPHAWMPDSRSLVYSWQTASAFEVRLTARGDAVPFGAPAPTHVIPRAALGSIAGVMEAAPDGRILALDREGEEDRTRLLLVVGWDR